MHRFRVTEWPSAWAVGSGHSQLDDEGVAHFGQHGLLVVDMLLLLQADDVRDAHHLEREELRPLLLLHQVDAAEGPRAWPGGKRGQGSGLPPTVPETEPADRLTSQLTE